MPTPSKPSAGASLADARTGEGINRRGYRSTLLVLFVGFWAFAVYQWGFWMGFGLGWIPAGIGAAILAFARPIFPLALVLWFGWQAFVTPESFASTSLGWGLGVAGVIVLFIALTCALDWLDTGRFQFLRWLTAPFVPDPDIETEIEIEEDHDEMSDHFENSYVFIVATIIGGSVLLITLIGLML